MKRLTDCRLRKWAAALLLLVLFLPVPARSQSGWGGEPVSLGTGPSAWPAELLVFSDHPERVSRLGKLCHGGLLPLRPVRWQFYHQGGMDAPLYLVLRVRNRGPQEAVLTTVSGIGTGTEDDYFQAGHLNNMEFLRNWTQGNARKLTVAPGETAVLWQQRLPRDIVVSGTVDWCLWQGREVEYMLYASASPRGPWLEHLLSEAEDVHARGIYPEPERYRRSTYDTAEWKDEKDGAVWAVGATRQPSAVCGPELKGDYGVIYRWDLRLSNSGDEPRTVEFAFNPRGGKATASFAVLQDGRWEFWERAEELDAFAFHTLARRRVDSHSAEDLVIYTLPEGASNYPVRLVVRPMKEAAE